MNHKLYQGFWNVSFMFAAIAAISCGVALDKAGDQQSVKLYAMGMFALILREVFKAIRWMKEQSK